MLHKWTAQIHRIILFTLFISIIPACSSLRSFGILEPRPNIVVILTDDMDMSLMPNMTNTLTLIADEGASFDNFFVTSPVCCASRASLLRGQYPHNTRILANSSPEGGFRRFFLYEEESETLAVWLNRAGYNTSLLGKYLNGYPIPAGRDHVPPGWTDWHVFLFQKEEDRGENNYVDFLMNENGKATQYGSSPEDYSTDLIARKSIDFMDRSIAEGRPFFILMSVYAPHGPNFPADRYADAVPDLVYPQSPSFNEADITDKPSTIRAMAEGGEEVDAGDADHLYVARTRSLLAVDDLVKDVVNRLEQSGQLDNTYIFFTSDNGFHIGEHKLPPGKATPYDEDIHVPLLVRGPGIQPGRTIPEIAANIDLAPTILDLAGLEPVDLIDGRSLKGLLRPEADSGLEWRKALVIEMGRMGSSSSSLSPHLASIRTTTDAPSAGFPSLTQSYFLRQIDTGAFRVIRAETFMYAEHKNGELEYYDMVADPYQMDNLAGELEPETLTTLQLWLDQLETCTADDCRELEAVIPAGLEDQP